MRNYSVVSIIILIIFSNCGSLEEDPSRIIWGKSIDGIAIDDNVSRVLRVFGEPDEIAYLDSYCGEAYTYNEGNYHGVEIHICNTLSENGGTVGFIGLEYPYSGTNKDGAGIGSTRESARSSYGKPDKTVELSDVWYYSDVNWSITYSEQDTTIERIVIIKLLKRCG